MLFPKRTGNVLIILLAAVVLVACNTDTTNAADSKIKPPSEPMVLKVYKRPTCGCCKDWVTHMNQNGYETDVHDLNNLSGIKQQHNISAQYQSCHTAISPSGFVFEGHVPAKFIQQFLNKPPKGTIGLAVPAMPVGTPGMEMGDKFMPYQVLLLNADGTSSVYAQVSSYQEQF